MAIIERRDSRLPEREVEYDFDMPDHEGPAESRRQPYELALKIGAFVFLAVNLIVWITISVLGMFNESGIVWG